MKNTNNYIVITGDVIASKKYNNFIELFANSIKEIKYPDSLIHPFKIAKGDEMQAVFNSDLNIPVFLRKLRNYIRPIKIRIGIGMGSVDNEDEIVSWESAGDAFAYSEGALKKIDQDRKFKTMLNTSSKIDDLANAIFLLLDTIEFNWSQIEWDAVHLKEENKNKKIFIDQDCSIKEILESANIEEVKQAENQLDLLIKNIYNF